MTTSKTTLSKPISRALQLRQLVEARISNPAAYVESGSLPKALLGEVQCIAKAMIELATDVARHQGETSVPFTRAQVENMFQFLRYSRQDPGSPVLPHHGLTLETQTLFSMLYNEGFSLEQQYTGPRTPFWQDSGPQQLLLRW